MAFFGKSLAARKIEIKTGGQNSDCPEIQKRLDRIESNYTKLDEILNQLESRFELDDRVTSEIDSEFESKPLTKSKPK